jgi:uncharacterized protein YtpQ (UPF0354 family)
MKLLFWRGRVSRESFRDRFIDALKLRFPDTTIRADEDLGVVIDGLQSGSSHTVWLERAYQEFEQDPKAIGEIFERWLAMLAETANTSDHPDRLSALVPMVKDRSWISEQQEAVTDFWIEDYNSELVVAYAVFRTGISFVSNADVAAFGRSKEDLRQLALENLRNKVFGNRSVIGEDGLYLVGVGGNLEASLVLDDEVWRDARIRIQGAPIVGLPDRDSFVVVGADEMPSKVFEAARMVSRLHRTEPYPVSDQLFRKTADRFEPLDVGPVDDSHPIPNLEVIDVIGKKKDVGATLALVIATPILADPRSIYRLFRKLDAYLGYVASEAYREECGNPDPGNTRIEVNLHAGAAPEVKELLGSLSSWAEKRGASLRVVEIERA